MIYHHDTHKTKRKLLHYHQSISVAKHRRDQWVAWIVLSEMTFALEWTMNDIHTILASSTDLPHHFIQILAPLKSYEYDIIETGPFYRRSWWTTPSKPLNRWRNGKKGFTWKWCIKWCCTMKCVMPRHFVDGLFQAHCSTTIPFRVIEIYTYFLHSYLMQNILFHHTDPVVTTCAHINVYTH